MVRGMKGWGSHAAPLGQMFLITHSFFLPAASLLICTCNLSESRAACMRIFAQEPTHGSMIFQHFL